MYELAQLIYPNREIQDMPPRIGDRLIEPLQSVSEANVATDIDGILQVVSS